MTILKKINEAKMSIQVLNYLTILGIDPMKKRKKLHWALMKLFLFVILLLSLLDKIFIKVLKEFLLLIILKILKLKLINIQKIIEL